MKNNDLLSACLVLYPFRSGLSKIKKILMVILVVFLPLTIVKAGNTKSSMEISQQQKKQISGLIRDVNNEPIIGANIIEKNVPGNGTVTDVDGRFTLSIEENATILVSYIGYLPQEISVAGKTYFEVILQEDTKTLDEVVVIGYGSQSRETITTSVTKLDNKVLENVPYANAASALQGSVSGVRVQSISGQPGAAPRIIVRGGTSINNPNGAAPLYIIDGVIRPDMNNISSDDIESIQVLKDAASTAIYGARGSNGVVIITTKSGKTDQLRVNYSFDYTISKVGKLYDFVNARQYIELNRYGLAHRPDKFPAIDLNRLTLPMGYGTGNDLTNNTAFTLQYLTPENEHKLKEGWQSMPDPADPSKTL
ncbi:MAG: TonB-dependent receptor plug domain-containing protein, partial [Petrimonas sp.]|nr:TonB-dependent receptor plug domain-containing protein [Petrimonas sp.]